MPLYTYHCPSCNAYMDVFSKIAERDHLVACGEGHPMQRILRAPMVQGDYETYDCPVTGRPITGRKAHKENLARLGCRLLEPGETAQFQRRKEADDEQFLERVAETAAQTVMRMPTVKREQLAKELDAGASVSYLRH
jgi:putative FmdB family regulatory protein